jgi:TRAP transporter TAXI family solute receptor
MRGKFPAHTVLRSVGVIATLIAMPACLSERSAAQERGAARLPNPMAWTSFWRGSIGYSQAIAIRAAFREYRGIDLRVAAAKTAVAQLEPLRRSKAHFALAGLGAAYLAQEGAFTFAARAWGPQPVRLLLNNNSHAAMALAVTARSRITSIAGLRGRRLPWIKSAPAVNQSVGALLAFAGLTWSDVRRVSYASHALAWTGLLKGKIDAAFGQTINGKAYRMAASARGLVWLPVPHDDRAGWGRLRAKAPYFLPHLATLGAGLSPRNPYRGASYPYPVLLAYADLHPGTVFAMTKAMQALYPRYAKTAPGLEGWALERQLARWVIPFHAGAIRYLKSKGRWSAAQQRHNKRLIRRQSVLRDAWNEVKSRRNLGRKTFTRAWRRARAMRLKAAGFSPIYH